MNAKPNLLTCLFAGSLLAATSMHAATVYSTSFENPDTATETNNDPSGWTQSFGGSAGYVRTTDEANGTFSTTFGTQAMRQGKGTGDPAVTTSDATFGLTETIVLGTTYTLTFNYAGENSGDGTAWAEFWSTSDDGATYTQNLGGLTTTATSATQDMSASTSLTWTADSNAGERLIIALATQSFTTPTYFDNIELDATAVPEVSTAMLLGVVGVLDFMARRKRA